MCGKESKSRNVPVGTSSDLYLDFLKFVYKTIEKNLNYDKIVIKVSHFKDIVIEQNLK